MFNCSLFLSRNLVEIYNFHKYICYKIAKPNLKALNNRLACDSEILYGIQPTLAALRFRQRKLKHLFVKKSYFASTKSVSANLNPWLISAIEESNSIQLPIHYVSQDVLDTITNGRSHQGVALECGSIPIPVISKIPPSLLHFQFCLFPNSNCACCGSSSMILLLDKLHDVMNLGNILRSAVFFGVPTVLISSYFSAMPSPLISKLSAGAMEVLKFYRTNNTLRTLKYLSEHGWIIIGTSGKSANALNDTCLRPALEISSVTPDMVRIPSEFSNEIRPMIIVLGSETQGLSDDVLTLCNFVIRIPGLCDSLDKSDVEHSDGLSPLPTSLNVATATGILLYTFRSLRYT